MNRQCLVKGASIRIPPPVTLGESQMKTAKEAATAKFGRFC